ncbi:MAG: putative toxin-antitoxin system toxin component, PIN family [Nitrosopumilus sp.]
MPTRKKIKIIIDTNLFISFLIGKRLHRLKQTLIDSSTELIFAEQNINELIIVTSRDKFRKYFTIRDVENLVDFIRITSKVYEIKRIKKICRDSKDDFLLALAKRGKANFLITGDNDLLDLKNYGKTKIISIDEFEKILESGTKA